MWGFLKSRGGYTLVQYRFGGPQKKAYRTLGCMLGSPIEGVYQIKKRNLCGWDPSDKRGKGFRV